MTYCILGFCETTGQSGIAYTTVTIAGGGTSPFYTYGGDIVVVQAYGNIATGIAGARALDQGQSPEEAMLTMEGADSAFDFRQVGIMMRDGRKAALTGNSARPWAGHHVGEHFIAMGNVLVGEEVVQAMSTAFTESVGETLAERLLRGIEAGRDAGGQVAPDGRYDERCALLKVFGAGPGLEAAPALDLRIDLASDAVTRMRAFYETYKPVIKRRAARALNPADDLPTSDWEAVHMQDNPPPPARK